MKNPHSTASLCRRLRKSSILDICHSITSKMTFTAKLKPSDCTVSKYDEKVVLHFRTITRTTSYELSIKCKLSNALENYGTVHRILLDSPDGVRALAFVGYDFCPDDETLPIENFNGYRDFPCGGTSGV